MERPESMNCSRHLKEKSYNVSKSKQPSVGPRDSASGHLAPEPVLSLQIRRL
jgi:hypothetical protein